jgi:peptidoglycan hydrolase-like amidase
MRFQICARCASITVSQPASIRAAGDALVLTEPRRSIRASRVSISAPVTLGAHGETLTLPWPVEVTARSGVLVMAVTIPIESYAERVVASESDDADSAASLEALAIVVRTFALHQTHGHTDYDLCDSTHCQLVRWNASTAQLAMVPRTAGACVLWKRLRRLHSFAGGDMARGTPTPVFAGAAGCLLHARRRP